EDNVATQPRGTLQWRLSSSTQLMLAAGAYRRPAEQLDEIIAGGLHPERTTHVNATLFQGPGQGPPVVSSVSYLDRTRVIIRDGNGVLVNSGFGTSVGAEVSVVAHAAPWYARLSTSLSHSTRLDHLRAAERPFEYDQPFRGDALLRWQ